MSEIDYKYIWDKYRKVYRVALDSPTYSSETKKTSHHYKTVGKSMTKDGEIIFGSKYQIQTELEETKKEVHRLRSAKDSQATNQQGHSKEAVSADNHSESEDQVTPEDEKPATNLEKSEDRCEEQIPYAKKVILVGETAVINDCAEKTGLKKILYKSFGKEQAEAILYLAFYLLATGDALSNSQDWLLERDLKSLDPSKISAILQLITQSKTSTFLKNWLAFNKSKNPLCYDITSISTYSENINQAEYGYNRDKEHLKQINLALVTDQETHTPLLFRLLNGSLSDVKTVEGTVSEFIEYGFTPHGIVMDRGFWSQENIDALHEKHIRVMIPVPSSVKWVKDLFRDYESKVYSADEYEDEEKNVVRIYSVRNPCKTNPHSWCHLVYSAKMAGEQREQRIQEHNNRRKELLSGTPKEEHKSYYDEYFTVKKRGKSIKVEEKKNLKDILNQEIFGFWALYTDIEKDPVKALKMYRTRNYIEVAFDDLKGDTDAKRLRVHSDKAVYGRLLIQFCAQILRNQLRNKVSEFPAETKKYASKPATILSRVRSFAKVIYAGRSKGQYVEMTKGQRLIFKALNIEFPPRSKSKK